MTTRPFQPQSPSPLDPHIRCFLQHLETLPAGFAPTTDLGAAGVACSVPEPFIDALFTSAKMRGLIEPFQPRGARGRYRWRVSSRGRQWRDAAES